MFICMAHNDYGSLVEAADAQYVWGPFATREEAEQAREEWNDETDWDNNWWVNIVEIPSPAVTTAEVAKEWFDNYGDE